MIDVTVSNFFSKNPESSYMENYETSHGPRLDALSTRYDLKSLKGHVADVGGGMGFLGKRLGPDADYWVIDGADIPGANCRGPLGHVSLSKGVYVKQDIDRDYFSNLDWYDTDTKERLNMSLVGYFDIAFCLETLEHLSNPYHCLEQIKKIVKPGGTVVLSIPPPSVWHNTIYPGLLWPKESFLQFLGQMALPVVNQWDYQPASIGWPAWTFVCRNDPWSAKRLVFPKDEAKFIDCTLLQATNL